MRSAALLSIAAACTWLTPAIASACSCFVQEALLWPKSGDLAEDEAVLLRYEGETPEDPCGGSLLSSAANEHRAFVDGTEVDLTPLEDRPGFALDPAPAVGATVTLVRCGYGEEACDPDTVSPDARWDLTVVEAAAEGPSAPTVGDVGYELVEYDNCGETVKARDWTIDVTPDDAEPRVHEILIGPAGEESRRFVFTASDEPLEYTIRRKEEDAGKNVCATVRSYDMAGNQSSEASSCYELGQRETLDRAGCSCAADPNPGRNLVLTLLALTVLLRTRRS